MHIANIEVYILYFKHLHKTKGLSKAQSQLHSMINYNMSSITEVYRHPTNFKRFNW